MSNPHPSLAPATEKVKALQYLFDIARTAPAPATVHEQARTYAQFLADSFSPPPPAAPAEAPAEEAIRAVETPVVPVA